MYNSNSLSLSLSSLSPPPPLLLSHPLLPSSTILLSLPPSLHPSLYLPPPPSPLLSFISTTTAYIHYCPLPPTKTLEANTVHNHSSCHGCDHISNSITQTHLMASRTVYTPTQKMSTHYTHTCSYTHTSNTIPFVERFFRLFILHLYTYTYRFLYGERYVYIQVNVHE